MDNVDVCIVGAGVIGLAIARQLSAVRTGPRLSIVLLDEDAQIGQHSSSRNSEVIHAGIYYPQDSLKARLCVRGKELLYEYCARRHIPHRRLGKLIVAQRGESERLAAIAQQALDNGVDDLVWLQQAQLREAAPAVRVEVALQSPSTGIIDSHAFMQSLLAEAEQAGVMYARHTSVEQVEISDSGFVVHSRHPNDPQAEDFSFSCQAFINSAGLQAQALAARIAGCDQSGIPRLYPCKGDYFRYSGKNPFRQLIYPLPEANTRGLGIHATLDLGGQLRFGPDSEYIDHIHYDIDAGKAGAFAEAIAKYFPAIDAAKLLPAYAGIRPKLSGPGMPAADFVIDTGAAANLIQLFGIESPGLTASLALAELVEAQLVI